MVLLSLESKRESGFDDKQDGVLSKAENNKNTEISSKFLNFYVKGKIA